VGRYLTLLLVGILACTPVASVPKEESPAMTAVATEGLPDELRAVQPVWETHQQATRNRSETVTRLYEDGRIFTLSDTRRRRVNGQLRREPAPLAWRLDAQIKPEGVARVQELVRSGFVQLSSTGTPAADQGVTVRRSNVDGVEHSVSLPVSATGDMPQVLRDIDYAINSNVIPGAVPIDQ
jgi:hypothetical protein